MRPWPGLAPEADPPARAAYVAYDVFGWLACAAAVPALPWLWWGGYRQGWRERLGRLPASFAELPAPPLWVHAASVGETLAAQPLVAELRRCLPGIPVVMSTTTMTGQKVARETLVPDALTLLPIDAGRCVQRAFRRVRPRALIVVETEIWPGLFQAAAMVDAPAMLVSGRVSPRSLRRYGWIAPLIRATMGRVAAFGMQTPGDAERIIALGAEPRRVCVTGSLKGNRPAPAGSPSVAGLSGRPVLIAASTQPDEEDFVLAAVNGLWQERADLLLVLAPRRPERFDEVEDLVVGRGLRYQRRTTMAGGVARETQVLLLDTVGELFGLFRFARAAFVGGTVAPLGGHNLLEPAACARPVAFGPHTENVAGAARALIAAGGGVVVRHSKDLEGLWKHFLLNAEDADRAGRSAAAVAAAGSEALRRTWDVVAPYLEDTGGRS